MALLILVLLLAVLLLLLLVAPCLNCLEAVKKPPPVAFKVMCLLPITRSEERRVGKEYISDASWKLQLRIAPYRTSCLSAVRCWRPCIRTASGFFLQAEDGIRVRSRHSC